MDFEDSRNAIFCDPHAFQSCVETKQIKKVVFAEPYDCLPNFYVDNNFKKHNCDCVPKPKPPKPPQPPKPCPPGFNFDLKSLMPLLLGLINKSGNSDLTKVLSDFAPSSAGKFDMQKIVGMVAQNLNIIQSFLKMFKGKGGGLSGLFKKSTDNKEEIKAKQTDHVIKNYTRV